jgi:SAM-dependent methyltransferase
MTATAKPALKSGSPERFGYSWHIFKEILPVHEEQFRRWTTGLPLEAWRGRTFLDVGCGIGRNSYWPMRHGAAGGLAIDVDDRSLAAARRNLADHPALRVEHRSAYEIGEEGRFDVVFSIGVIHHLEDPDLALRQMVQAAKPGGRVLVWLYGAENNEWITSWFNPLRNGLFRRLPLPLVFALSYGPTAGLWAALRMGLGSIEYFRLLRTFSFRHLQAIVFDHMIPRIARYYTREEARRLLERAGLVDVKESWVNEMSWTVIGIRPPGP